MSRPAGFRHTEETKAKMRAEALTRRERGTHPHYRREDRYVRAQDGYVLVRHQRSSSGWELEHRLVAEEKIGRPLLDGEVVHHIDRDRTNNDSDNLEVLPSQAAHRLLHFEEDRES